MARIGIIAEFNPLHLGHKYLIDEAKKLGEIVTVISSNFVQRGDTAIFEKRTRTKMALRCGADLVLEMPVCYSMSTAQSFALCGVSALKAVGCDCLMFGSEMGEVEPLLKTAEVLLSEEFSQKLAFKLKEGVTFASARQSAAEECGAPVGILQGANNNLAIEYIIAAKSINTNFKFLTLKRQGSGHDSGNTENGFASASLIREKLYDGDYDFAKKYMPKEAFDLINLNEISKIENIETAILSNLRTKSINDLKNLPDISEGVENKLFSAIRVATSLNEVYNNVKSKRYTLARIRRMVLSAFLGIDNSFFMQKPEYVRVLGFNKTGEEIIRQMRKLSETPLILKATEIKGLSVTAQKMFELENKATDLYLLSLKKPAMCGLEYKANLIKTEC
ncbi:MAG: nucleotidyltransferase family protein [Clostridia bacterium]|nr:nucleotidyltransferase family protein [Clostridia bacterium]